MELLYDRLPCQKPVDVTALVSVEYLELPKDFVFQAEHHRCWELNFIDYGSLRTWVDGREMLLQKQDMLLHAPMTPHGILEKTENTPNVASVAFESTSPALYDISGRIIRLSPELQKLLRDVFQYVSTISEGYLPVNELDRARHSPNPQKDLILQLAALSLEKLLLELLRANAPQPAARTAKLTTENQKTNLARMVEEYVNAHLDEKLSLARLSRHFNVSINKLSRDIRATTHRSPQELVAHQRLKAAKQMIRQEEYNFTQIAERLGFSSLHYFSQWFKKQTRMSPTEYATSVRSRSES